MFERQNLDPNSWENAPNSIYEALRKAKKLSVNSPHTMLSLKSAQTLACNVIELLFKPSKKANLKQVLIKALL